MIYKLAYVKAAQHFAAKSGRTKNVVPVPQPERKL